MRRFSIVIAAAALMFCSAALLAQKVTTPEELDKTMKKIGPAQQAINKALMANAYADAKTQVQIVRQALTDAENFWTIKKKDDAIKFSREAIGKVDALDKALSAPTPDNAAVMAAFKEIGGACRNCHMTYRVQDENQQFILKPGSV